MLELKKEKRKELDVNKKANIEVIIGLYKERVETLVEKRVQQDLHLQKEEKQSTGGNSNKMI